MVSETTAGATGATASNLLAALCQDVLGTAHAQLVPLGRMAPLVTTPLCYPPQSALLPLTSTPSLPRDLEAGMTRLTAAFAPYGWAISLWDERGRMGVLLVGEKLDDGLYSQEEMETAQAAGERIVQLLAGEQMVRRLMELQRKRTVEQRVMDLRTRRTLHDEILPALHLAVLQLGRADRQEATVAEALGTLTEAHAAIAALLTASQPAPTRAADPCELVSALRTLVAHEFAHSFEEVCWQGWLAHERPLFVDDLVGEVVVGAAREAIRNAATHGRGGHAHRPLRLEIGLCVTEERAVGESEGEAGEITLTIQDNGVGLGAAQRSRVGNKREGGNGLSLHSTLLAMVGGYLAVESSTNGGTVVRIGVGRSSTILL
jgi:anti-sigma regulatory factor (Ser/Thr protein kinase)